MSEFPSSSSKYLRFLNPLFVCLHVVAFAIVRHVTPEPFIDEIFHVPQAQAYCRGDFGYWDDKITTPPGLYLLSYAISRFSAFLGLPIDACSITCLRLLNLFTVCCVLPYITSSIYRRVHPTASQEHLLVAGVLPAFPLLSFYGNLFYTDAVSTALVLSSYLCALQNRHILSGMLGAFSVLTRQTNIIWVAFIMAVSIIRQLKEVDVVDPDSETRRSWLIFDPLAADAQSPVDYIVAARQCLRSVFANPYAVLPIFLSYSYVFIGFVLFLLWNKGIVMGDRSNHIAGINFPQLFYCTVVIAGFGAPLLISSAYIRKFFRSSIFGYRNLLISALIMGLLSITVHYNTIEHPFLRADNRHFVFYIWRRTVKRNAFSKYIAVPFYYASGWFILTALSYSQSAMFVLGMVLSTALTIIPSPLLEFRYFVLPYILWRLHISPNVIQEIQWRGVLEYVWYETINLICLWIYVSKPFTWPSEPGKVQRFIW